MPPTTKTTPTPAPEPKVAAEVDLAGAPVLRPMGTMRARERAALMTKVTGIEDALPKGEQGAELGMAEAAAYFGAVADMDELLESVAVDPGFYATWATVDGGGPDVEQRIGALFARLAGDLGKSFSSAS